MKQTQGKSRKLTIKIALLRIKVQHLLDFKIFNIYIMTKLLYDNETLSALLVISEENLWVAHHRSFAKETMRGPLNSPRRGKVIQSFRVPFVVTLTLSQWSSSGNPVAIQCAWNLDPSVHWNATGEMPVCFQWYSSGFPVVFQCVPIMQINTGSPLEHHWVPASASVVPVASQCTCGSSGLPVCSNYAN